LGRLFANNEGSITHVDSYGKSTTPRRQMMSPAPSSRSSRAASQATLHRLFHENTPTPVHSIRSTSPYPDTPRTISRYSTTTTPSDINSYQERTPRSMSPFSRNVTPSEISVGYQTPRVNTPEASRPHSYQPYDNTLYSVLSGNPRASRLTAPNEKRSSMNRGWAQSPPSTPPLGQDRYWNSTPRRPRQDTGSVNNRRQSDEWPDSHPPVARGNEAKHPTLQNLGW
jgi:hypothetical protein